MVNEYKEWLSVKDRYKIIYPDGYLNIRAYRNGLLSEGEGLNFEIFTQGCMRHCRGCRNVLQSSMILSKLIDIKRLAQIVKDNMNVAVDTQENITDTNKFLEKLFLLYLERQLMGQRQLTLFHSPFKEIPYILLVKAWNIKYSLLNRLTFSLMDNKFGPRDKTKKKIPITGITFCGGEPLYQAGNILKFVTEVKKHYPFKIWIMTGFTYEDIIRYKEIRVLFNSIDYLIDGPFIIRRINLAHSMRGSMNQRIINVKESLKRSKIFYWLPEYQWTRLFAPFWERFSNPNHVQSYDSFISSDEVIFYLRNVKRINNISTVREYEEYFGDILKNFESRILY